MDFRRQVRRATVARHSGAIACQVALVLREYCHQFRLYQVENELTARLEQAAKKEISYADFLDELLSLEVGSMAQKHHQMRIAMARFPFQKTLESFDFKFQPSIDPKQIRELATGRYMEGGDSLLLFGPPDPET